MTPELEARWREAIAGLGPGREAGAITQQEEMEGLDTQVLEVELLENGEYVGLVQWRWDDSDTVIWSGLDTPADEGWLSYLSGALPPIAAEMGFKRLVAGGAPRLVERLRLTGLEAQEGMMVGDLADRGSRFWSYLDFKAGRAPEPAWRESVRMRRSGGES